MALGNKNITVDKLSRALASREGRGDQEDLLNLSKVPGISPDSILQGENKVMLGIRLTPYEKKVLGDIAIRQKRTLSSLCRIVLIDYLNKNV